MRRLGAITVVAIFALAGGLAACSSSAKSSHSSSSGTATTGTPKQGGTLTIIKSLEQTAGWDPINLLPVGHGSPTIINSAVYDSLFVEDPTTFALEPRLGSSVTTSDGGTTWTLKLRPNVKFSDGTAFGASAVEFNWQRIADPANHAQTASTAQAIQAMSVVDPLTLKITLKTPDLYFDHRIAENIDWIGSPSAIKSEGTNFGTHPVGAGPFTMQSWVTNSQYTLVKNPTYWEAGRPYLDKVIVKIVPDSTQAYNTFKSGGGEVIQLGDPQTISQAQKDSYDVPLSIASGGGFAIAFNNAKAPFNNPLARKAIDLAINRTQFLQTRYGGNSTFAMPAVEKQGSPFYDSNITPAKYDAAQAQKLVDQYVAQTGHPLQFTMIAFSTSYLAQDAQVLQAQLNQLKNVKVSLDVESATQGATNFATGNFQAFSGFTVRWNVPAIGMAANFLSTSTQNYWHYSNPDVDAALQKLQATTDVNAQKPLVQTIEKDVLNDSAVAYYMQYVTATAIDKTVRNYQVAFDQQAYLDNVWLSS